MSDTRHIKERYDLRRIVERDLGQPPIRSGRGHGRASLYKCPFHNERRGYSLAVWADGYRCFGACDTGGDLFDWLMNYRRLSFTEALAVLGEQPQEALAVRPRIDMLASEPPPDDWQIAARQVVDIAEETLWSTAGEPALNYLIGRGLNTHTIRTARLGYVPGDFRDWREIAGLNVPCGIMSRLRLLSRDTRGRNRADVVLKLLGFMSLYLRSAALSVRTFCPIISH